MKKTIPLLIAASLLLGACAGKNDTLGSYVKLGALAPLEVDFSYTEVTDEMLDEEIENDLGDYADYVDKTDGIETGDYAALEIYAESDGEVLYDYTGEELYDMVVGDGDWGEDFDAFLIGKKVGDEGTYEYSYGEDTEDAALAGRDVTIDYRIEEVQAIVKPALDEAFAEELGFDTLEAYKAEKRASLEADTRASDIEEYKQLLLEAVVENSTFQKYPSSLKKEAKQAVEDEYRNFADMFGMELSEAYDMFGITEETIDEEADLYAKEEIVFDAIAEEYAVGLTEQEFQERLEQFAADEEYDSPEEAAEDYGEEELRTYFRQQKILDYLMEQNPLP